MLSACSPTSWTEEATLAGVTFLHPEKGHECRVWYQGAKRRAATPSEFEAHTDNVVIGIGGGVKNGVENKIYALYQLLLNSLAEATDPVWATYEEMVQCKKGCAGCCSDGISIQYMEAVYLLYGFMHAEKEVQQAILKRLQDKSLAGRMRCPLLVNNQCSLYDQRPLHCRLVGLMLREPQGNLSTCELNFPDESMPDQVMVVDPAVFKEVARELSEQMWRLAPYNQGAAPELSIRQFLELFLRSELAEEPVEVESGLQFISINSRLQCG
jgi:Fe-S-cluster containining protein